jgi:hypothetical protein
MINIYLNLLVQNCYFEILPLQKYSFLDIETSNLQVFMIKYCETGNSGWHFGFGGLQEMPYLCAVIQ